MSAVPSHRPLSGIGSGLAGQRTAHAVRRFAVHGLAVELMCGVPALHEALGRQLGLFEVADLPDGFQPITGSVEPFDASAVLRHLSPNAVRFSGPDASMDLYQDGDRYWVVDDRWGMAELNLLRGRWRAWVLPQPTLDAVACAEAAIVWPLAQLLRVKGLHLLPAVSVVRDGWGALILSPFDLAPELAELLKHGYQIVGQRWTGVREEDGRIVMLHLPGWVERQAAPRLRALGVSPPGGRVDLMAELPDASVNHAFCQAVLIAEPGRRPAAHLRELVPATSVHVMRRAWPLVDLQPSRKAGQLIPRLMNGCKCVELQLSRDPMDLLRLLDGVRPRRERTVTAELSPNPDPLPHPSMRWQAPRALAG